MHRIKNENQDPRIPKGWTIVVYPDCRALPVSPGCTADELGGYRVALDTYEEALELIKAWVES